MKARITKSQQKRIDALMGPMRERLSVAICAGAVFDGDKLDEKQRAELSDGQLSIAALPAIPRTAEDIDAWEAQAIASQDALIASAWEDRMDRNAKPIEPEPELPDPANVSGRYKPVNPALVKALASPPLPPK